MKKKKEMIGLPTNAGRETIAEFIDKWTRSVDGCLIWQAERFASGFGYLRIGGAAFAVRRIVWWLEHGYLPQGDKMTATCGDSGCHKLEHLRDHTTPENRRTTLFKDGKSGFNMPRIKPQNVALVWDQLNILGGTTIKECARRWGVSVSCLRKHLKRYEENLPD